MFRHGCWGKCSFANWARATAVMGGQGRENGNAGATHIAYAHFANANVAYAHVANAHVAKLHCSSATDCFASAWPWKGGRCMRTLARFETAGSR